MAMDVQRTIEFILQSQAKAEVRADRADARMDRIDAQLKATANLVREGMKIVQTLARDRKETRQELRALAQEVRDLTKAQARTEATLERYLKFRSNGHNGGKRNGRSSS
jgi:chromosome segregation ATPase